MHPEWLWRFVLGNSARLHNLKKGDRRRNVEVSILPGGLFSPTRLSLLQSKVSYHIIIA